MPLHRAGGGESSRAGERIHPRGVMAAGRGRVSLPPTEAQAPGSPSPPPRRSLGREASGPPRLTSAAALLLPLCNLHTVRMRMEIVPVETNLGLRPTGVERLGEALLGLGLAEGLDAEQVERYPAPAFDERRDPVLGARNVSAVAALAVEQADRVGADPRARRFPVVLGGDDSVLLGCLLALRRRGSAGLVLLDGHTDFWDLPDGTGELSDSDLWIATGHGPAVLADLEGRGPLVAPRRAWCTGIATAPSSCGRQPGRLPRADARPQPGRAARGGRRGRRRPRGRLSCAPGAERVWLHLDADCLDDALMPAVDWRVGRRPDARRGRRPGGAAARQRAGRRHRRHDLQPRARHR